ncbi:unnamed protein product [Phytomonas sp. Hart1]|nr:unnamed protein product [Phytomonas sp. Hart1]|eukprot:CCW70205.1 unnamed protein product [Phytomonas sp. isolate Hart1]
MVLEKAIEKTLLPPTPPSSDRLTRSPGPRRRTGNSSPASDVARTPSSGLGRGYRSYYRLPFLEAALPPPSSSSPLRSLNAVDCELAELLKGFTPASKERDRRLQVLMDLELTLSPIDLHVEVFGSTMTGLTTMDSDLDCVVIRKEKDDARAGRSGTLKRTPPGQLEGFLFSSSMMAKRNLAFSVRDVANEIRRTRKFSKVIPIGHARVPIVKCHHCNTGLNVDLSLTEDGLISSYFLCAEYMRPENEMARALTVLIKTVIACNDLGDPSKGGLGSFPIALMVLFFLQTEVKERYPATLHNSLAVLFSGFIKYYGATFDFVRLGIDYVRRKSFVKGHAHELYIKNPIYPEQNCAKAAHLYATKVVPFFKNTADELCPLLDDNIPQYKIDTILSRVFRKAINYYGGWTQLQETANKYKGAPQHSWDLRANIYTGSLVENLL